MMLRICCAPVLIGAGCAKLMLCIVMRRSMSSAHCDELRCDATARLASPWRLRFARSGSFDLPRRRYSRLHSKLGSATV
jgi:hypothetical protein